MQLTLERKWKKDKYTIGNLYIDGEWFSNTLEDKDRGLTSDMSLEQIKKNKVYGETAIPTGTYEIALNVVSPKFDKYPFYHSINGGRLPRLLNVKGYDGVLIHVMDGNKGAALSLGCIGIGRNLIKGGLLQGKDYYRKLYNVLQTSKDKIYLTIK